MENRRFILAIALILFVWSGFNLLFPTAKKAQQEESLAVSQPEQVKTVLPVREHQVQAAAVVSNDKLPMNSAPERKIKISSDLYDLVFSTEGARLIRAQLNQFKEVNTPDSALVKVIDAETADFGSYGVFGGDGLYLPENLAYSFASEKNEIHLSSTDKTDIVFQATTPDNLRITKTFTFYPDKYYFDLNIKLENLSSSLKKGTINLSIVDKWDDSIKGDRYNFVGAVSFDGEDLFEDAPKDLKEKSKSYGSNILWTSFTTKYFSNIVKPFEGSIKNINISFKNSAVVNTIVSPFSTFDNNVYTFKYEGFVGPRDYELLKETGLSFERIIDLGFFGIIAKPLMTGLKFFYGYLGNFGFSIVLLTVCIKLLFWPLTQKSYSSMKDMQKLQPQMQKLRAKHGKDKQKLNQEMMALYKENRVNPFGGCLPMLVQIPVFFALYQVLLGAIELRHAPFMLWITDLSAADTLISDAFNLSFALGPLPLIMGFTMFLQQKMTPTNMDPTQAKIMMFMPVFFTFIFLSFPSGLVVYWLVNNLLTIAQQYMINRKTA